jgi:hypothetical protein
MPSMRHWFERLEPRSPIGRGGVVGLALLAVVFVIFFGLTLKLEAFPRPGKGDLDVFLRAGWAAREGQSLYKIADEKHLHYEYPPLFACLSIPLADPPPYATAAQRHAIPPYWLSATIWYWLSIGCVVGSLHLLASALETVTGARGPPFSKAWWALRVWPLLVFLVCTGDSLRRGQATPFILLFLSIAGASILRGRPFKAGLNFGFVGVMKLFPLYLLLYPAWRFDRRMMIGAAAGVLAALLLPVAIMGPAASMAAYREFVVDRMAGEVSGHGDPKVKGELHGTNARIQSFEYIAYDTVVPSRAARAVTPPRPFFIFHLAVSALVTAGALWLMRRKGDPAAEFLFFGALVVLAIPILPVSRPHYFMLEIIPFMGLLAVEWPRFKGLWPGWPVAGVTIATLAAEVLVACDQPQAIDLGLTTYAALALALLALLVGRRRALSVAGEEHRLAGPSPTRPHPEEIEEGGSVRTHPGSPAFVSPAVDDGRAIPGA